MFGVSFASVKKTVNIPKLYRTRNKCSDVNRVSVLPMRVFPVPGGPNRSNPFGGPRKPVNISLKTYKHAIIVKIQAIYVQQQIMGF